MATAQTTPSMTDRELNSWKGFLRTHALLTKQLDADLERQHRISLSSYEVLLRLSHADSCRMRMSELAESVILSRSGLTRLVDRLEREGLLERSTCPNDARGFNACLTDAGRELFAQAQRTHIDGIRRMFLAALSDAQQDQLVAVWDQLAPPSSDEHSCG